MTTLRVIQQVGALLAVCLALVAAQNYCNTTLCGSSTHIACNNNGSWAAACPKSPAPRVVANTRALRNQIVRMHNQRRNRLALGNLSTYASARRMATMGWSAQLANMARLNVRQCKMQHDACHNTAKFPQSGQNLALYSYSGAASSKTDKQLVTKSITSWWQEYKNANQKYMSSYPNNYSGPAIGHFTAMAQENNTHVGCAMARYYTGGMNRFLMACNYATTNIIGQPVYNRGATASRCQTGRNVNFRGLCKLSEDFSN